MHFLVIKLHFDNMADILRVSVFIEIKSYNVRDIFSQVTWITISTNCWLYGARANHYKRMVNVHIIGSIRT